MNDTINNEDTEAWFSSEDVVVIFYLTINTVIIFNEIWLLVTEKKTM